MTALRTSPPPVPATRASIGPAPGAGELWTGFAIAAAFALLAQWGGEALPLALHAINAGLVYVLFSELSKRRVGAPLIAAVLFGASGAVPHLVVHLDSTPLEILGSTALGVFSAVLLVRSPRNEQLLWPALLAYAGSVSLAPEGAALPAVVAVGIVAYQGLDPARLFSKRHLRRFIPFGCVLLLVVAARSLLLPNAHRGTDCGPTNVPAHAVGSTIGALLPPPLSSGVWDATHTRWGNVFAAMLLLKAGIGEFLVLRTRPKVGFAAVGWAICALTPVVLFALQLHDASYQYLAPAFALLLVAEVIERLFFAFGGRVAMPLLLSILAAFIVQSRLFGK